MSPRTEAKALGLKRYVSTKPCKAGHVGEHYTSTGDCVVCAGLRTKAYYNGDLTRSRKYVLDKRYQSAYGITLDKANEIKTTGCEICGTTEGTMCIDHCHTTGKVRGCLCSQCNTAIGMMKDDVGRLASAIQYLQRER